MKKLILPGLLLLSSGFFILSILYLVFTRVPSREQTAGMFRSVGKIYAYEVWDGKPYMLFAQGESDQGFLNPGYLYFDTLLIARQQPHYLFLFDRQWSGSWYYIPYTTAAASLGKGHCTGYSGLLPPKCTSTDLFGQINDRSIRSLEVKMEEKWQSYPTRFPGFAIRILNFTGDISDYRWLDDKNQIVWSKTQDNTVTFPF